MKVSLQVHNRQYSEHSFVPPEIITTENPLENKWFHGDVIETDTLTVEYSPLRNKMHIPGILILENNRTYGRTDNKKKLYYKCRPFCSNYPDFLVPYTIQMGFQKNFKNKYIVFKFDHWNQKHPIGVLGQTIGDVHDLTAFYEYMLYCKELHMPITPFIKTCKALMTQNDKKYYQDIIDNNPVRFGIIERKPEEVFVFTIDPEGCTDRDDALSIVKTDTGYVVHVYIANVWVWIEAMDLWKYLGSRASTIYLPDSKRAMLPSTISEELCSLDENKETYTVAMKIPVQYIHEKNCYEIDFQNTLMTQMKVKIDRSFVYEEKSLLKSKQYRELRTLTTSLDSSVKDSHDVVAYWMMKMNILCANKMRQQKYGIFRSVQSKIKLSTTTHTDNDVGTFLRIWEQQMSGTYVNYSENMNVVHEMLQTNEYVHFTSPIRRIVDFVNQLLWVKNQYNLTFSTDVEAFMDMIVSDMDKLNSTMKNIRKVQSDCDVLCRVYTNTDITESILDVVILTRIDEHKYNVYVPDLKWIATIHSLETFEIYQHIKCKVYIFENEEQMRKKIRLQVM